MAEVARGPVSVAVVPPGSTLPPEIEIDREKVMAALSVPNSMLIEVSVAI